MSDIQPTFTGFISPYGDYSRRNTQALSGVSHLWQDFFARALADQSGEAVLPASLDFPAVDLDSTVEPTVGSDLLAHIVWQRDCDVKDTQIRPPKPLFLPIAEFDVTLLDPPFPAFPAEVVVAQQQQQDFDSSWVRPIVLSAGQPAPPASPAPSPRPLHLPIAELEWQLLDPPLPPFSPDQAAAHQQQLEFDNGWARPIILQNLRIAA